MLQGVLNAGRMEIVNCGDLMRFEGGVTMTMMLDNPAAPKEKTGSQ